MEKVNAPTIRQTGWRRILIALCVGLAQAPVSAQEPSSRIELPAVFKAKLIASGMVFDASGFRDFQAIRVLSNRQVSYELAVKHKSLPMEVRYAVQKVKGDALGLRTHALAMSMNVARKGNPDPEILSVSQINPTDLRREYGADIGSIIFFVPNPTFSTYKGGVAWTLISERNSTVAMVILLFTPVEKGFIPQPVLEAAKDIQYALRYNN